ncbi:MAG: hypothetical protein HYY68_09765 [Thaumarchaeota archaeon]|nr:hypothetical protein [Nitrososphaerota archaeon]
MKTKAIALASMIGSLVGGVSVLLFNMGLWSSRQNLIVLLDASNRSSLVLNFFLVEVLAIALISLSTSFILRALASRDLPSERIGLHSLISRALRSKRSVRVGVVFGIVYGLIYAFASSTVVVQPGTDFGTAYGVTEPGWVGISCCGTFGTVPKLILFPAPALHVGIQLIPLTGLFLVVVPLLVGFNFALVAYALAIRATGRTGSWLSTIGASVGLFTACPTCAGFFLAGAVGGIGASSLAISLAPYQILFVAISITVLLFTPVIIASTTRRYLNSSCDIR